MTEIQKNELRDQFLGNVDSWLTELGITNTQIPIIDQLLNVVVSTSNQPERVIKTATRPRILGGIRYEQDFWLSLKSLMRQAEKLDGQRWIYTPEEFVRSMRPFADSSRQVYSQNDITQSNPLNRGNIMELADECVRDRYFVLEFLANGFLPRANYEENVEFYKNPYVARQISKANKRFSNISYRYLLRGDNVDELHGMMRSATYCGQVSQFIFKSLDGHLDDATLFWADGRIAPYFYQHYVVMTTPTGNWPGGETPKMVIKSDSPAEFGNMLVVDSALLQALDHNAFLEGIPYRERIPFIRTLSPDLFSETGIFVGNFVDYIYILNLLGLADPEFRLTSSLPEVIHP